MGVPSQIERWKRNQSLGLLVALPICVMLWLATITSWQGAYWEWTQMALASLVLLVGSEVLRNGLATLFLASRLTQDTLVSLSAATGFCFGFVVCVLESTGFLSDTLRQNGSLAGPFFAASSTVVGVRLLSGYLRKRTAAPTLRSDETLPSEPLHRWLRPALFAGFVIGLSVTVPMIWPVGGIPAVVSLTLTLLAGVSPESFHLLKSVLRRCSDANLACTPTDPQMRQLAGIDTLLLEKSQVVTQGVCELCEVITLDSGTCEEEVLHFAAMAEFLLPPNSIRSAILRRARDALRTVPTLKGYQHMPGRGVSARYRNQQLLFGNLEWLREKGHSQKEIAELREETRDLCDGGKTVLYVSLAGKVMGAISLYDPPRPEIEPFVRELGHLDVGLFVVTGDTPETVKGLLKAYPSVRVIAGLRPTELAESLRDRDDLGRAIALVAKRDSLLASNTKSLIDTLFEFDRTQGFVAVTSSRDAPVDLHGASLDRISHVLRLARRLVRTEQIRVRLLAAYHLMALPGALGLATQLISWKFYGLVGILMGALLPILVVPSKSALGKGLANETPPDASGAKAGPSSEQNENDSETDSTGIRRSVTT